MINKIRVMSLLFLLVFFLTSTEVSAQSSNPNPITTINGWDTVLQSGNSCGQTAVSVGLRKYFLSNVGLLTILDEAILHSGNDSRSVQEIINLIDHLLSNHNKTANITVYVSFPTPYNPSPTDPWGVGSLTPSSTTPSTSKALNKSVMFVLYRTHWVMITSLSNGRPIPSGGTTPGGLPPIPGGNNGVIYDIEIFDPSQGFIKGNLAYTEFNDLSGWYIIKKSSRGFGRWSGVRGLLELK